MIKIIDTKIILFEDVSSHTVDIIIGQNNESRLWTVGGLPLNGDLQQILDGRFNELWREAQRGPAIDFWDWALNYLNAWRSDRRSASALTESMYYEAQRWQTATDTPFGLDSQRGRKSRKQYAAWVVTTWQKIEADYNLAVSLVKQAGTVETIELILSRRL